MPWWPLWTRRGQGAVIARQEGWEPGERLRGAAALSYSTTSARRATPALGSAANPFWHRAEQK